MGTIQNAIDNVAMKALAATAVKDQKTNQDLQHLSQLSTQRDVLTKEQQDLENEGNNLRADKKANKKEIKKNEDALKFTGNTAVRLQESIKSFADLFKDTGDIEFYKQQLEEESDLINTQRDIKRFEQSKLKLNLERNKYNLQSRQLKERREALQGRVGAFDQQAEFFNKKQRIGTTIEPIGGKK